MIIHIFALAVQKLCFVAMNTNLISSVSLKSLVEAIIDHFLNPFSAKPIFGRKKSIVFSKFYSYFSFYAREKSFNP